MKACTLHEVMSNNFKKMDNILRVLCLMEGETRRERPKTAQKYSRNNYWKHLEKKLKVFLEKIFQKSIF